MRAMVLAAGLGTRLRPVTWSVPKPMVPVLNRPVMEHILRLLASHGITEVIANLHWFPDTIENYFGDGSSLGINLTYSHEDTLHGTAGGVYKAREYFDGSFLVISGDALTDVDLTRMREYHETHDGIATLATKQVTDTSDFGVVITDDDGRIQGFQEKPDPAEALSNLANCGIYMFRPEIFDYFPEPGASKLARKGGDYPDDFADWAYDVFPALMEAGIPFYSCELDSYWNDVGTIEELRQGTFDGLEGKVDLAKDGVEVREGVWANDAAQIEGLDIEGPALIGPDCRFGDGVTITGPAVLGAGCRIGDGVRLSDVILLEKSQMPDGSFAVGGVVGR